MEEGLPARAASLRAALDRLATGDSSARDEVRRIAHRLRGTAGSHGHDALGSEAAEVESLAAGDADEATLVARGLALVTAIRRAAQRAPREPLARAASEPPAPSRPLTGRRVLALDDDGPTRRLLELTLGTMGGAEARVLESPEQALALLDREPFDVLIVDAMMPTTTGLALAREARLRAHGARPTLVFLSAATHDELGWTLPAGSHWLQKPFRPRELLDALGTILGGDAPARS